MSTSRPAPARVRPTVLDEDECGICAEPQTHLVRILTPLDGWLWLCDRCYDDCTGTPEPAS